MSVNIKQLYRINSFCKFKFCLGIVRKLLHGRRGFEVICDNLKYEALFEKLSNLLEIKFLK